MSQQARLDVQAANLSRPGRHVEWPTTGHRNAYPSELFGSNVFGLKQLQEALPKPVYAKFLDQIKVSECLRACGRG
jgi:glutamine synthetase